jgi:hypothetical protein
MANYKITKESKVFDRRKIGVGDIIEFNVYSENLFRKNSVKYKVAGIVKSVQAYDIDVKVKDDDYGFLKTYVLDISEAENIRMLYRAHNNVKGGEPYGEKL